jgi:flagellar basal body-associated protein FliL
MDGKKKKIIIAVIIGVLLVGTIAVNVFSFTGINKNKESVAAIQGKSV